MEQKKKQGTSAGSAKSERRQKSDRAKTCQFLRVVPARRISGAEKTCCRFWQNYKPFSFGFSF